MQHSVYRAAFADWCSWDMHSFLSWLKVKFIEWWINKWQRYVPGTNCINLLLSTHAQNAHKSAILNPVIEPFITIETDLFTPWCKPLQAGTPDLCLQPLSTITNPHNYIRLKWSRGCHMLTFQLSWGQCNDRVRRLGNFARAVLKGRVRGVRPLKSQTSRSSKLLELSVPWICMPMAWNSWRAGNGSKDTSADKRLQLRISTLILSM